jgi:hypothetical protein
LDVTTRHPNNCEPVTTSRLRVGIGTTSLIWFDNLSNKQIIDLFAQRRDIEKAVLQRLDDAYGAPPCLGSALLGSYYGKLRTRRSRPLVTLPQDAPFR